MTMTHSVDEILRAARALDAGHFRVSTHVDPAAPVPAHDTWDPTGPVLAVAGVTGRVGATTLALAIAEASADRARLVDASRMHTSGLAAATSAELGVTDTGWRRGQRGALLVERAGRDWPTAQHVPIPDPCARELTVVDIGRELTDVIESRTWLADVVGGAPVVLVTAATVPALRRLDLVLGALGRPAMVAVVVVGPARRRWPRPVAAAVTPRLKDLEASGFLTVIPPANDLAWSGVSSDPLPSTLLRSAESIAGQLLDPTKGNPR